MMQSPPLNLFGHATAKAATLQLAVVLLSLLVLLLGGIVAYLVRALAQQPMHWIAGMGPGLSLPGVVPDEMASEYGVKWLETRYTFTPETLKIRHAAILRTLHPTLRKPFEVQMEQEVLMVREAKMSSQLTVLETVVHRPETSQWPLRVQMTARRTTWIGGQELPAETVQGTLTLMPWLSRGEPQGLVVIKVEDTPPLRLRGK
jgi:hypothetical protein